MRHCSCRCILTHPLSLSHTLSFYLHTHPSLINLIYIRTSLRYSIYSNHSNLISTSTSQFVMSSDLPGGPSRNISPSNSSNPTTSNNPTTTTTTTNNTTNNSSNETTKKTARKLTDFYPHLGMIFPIAYSATSNKQADGYTHKHPLYIYPTPYIYPSSLYIYLPSPLPSPSPLLLTVCPLFYPPTHPPTLSHPLLPHTLPLTHSHTPIHTHTSSTHPPTHLPSHPHFHPPPLPLTHPISDRFTARALIESLQFQAKLYQEWMEVMGETETFTSIYHSPY